MAPSEYVSGGGRLKIKGSKVQDGRVDKKKKKKKTKIKQQETTRQNPEEEERGEDVTREEAREGVGEDVGEAAALVDKEQQVADDGKTAAERRYAEAKRKRLNERLKREGVKTHKERVEELNKYLSNLSEHHDMPRIGPG